MNKIMKPIGFLVSTCVVASRFIVYCEILPIVAFHIKISVLSSIVSNLLLSNRTIMFTSVSSESFLLVIERETHPRVYTLFFSSTFLITDDKKNTSNIE